MYFCCFVMCFFFFFNDTATTEIYTLSLHDALPIFRLTGDCPSQECLACARRADKQYALRHRPTEPGVLLRVFEEIDDFLELTLGLVDAGHVGEGDAHGSRLRLVVALGSAATESEWAA